MLGSGQFNGQCLIASYSGTTSSVGPNCTGFFDVFDYRLGGYQFESGTWSRVPGPNLFSGITSFGGTEHVLEATGSSALCVLRPSLRTHGLAGEAWFKCPNGTSVRLYSDVVRTPGSSYVELLTGTSGHLRAHSSLQQRTLVLNLPSTDGIHLATQVCQYADDLWYLTAAIGNATIAVPCSAPRYGRMALAFEGLSGTATVTMLSLAGLGPSVNAAGNPSTEEFDTCRCADCPPPDCGCLPGALDVTISGFDEYLGGTCTPASPNGAFTLIGPVSGVYYQWAATMPVVCSGFPLTTLSIGLRVHYEGGYTYAVASIDSATLTGQALGRGCDKLSGLVLSDNDGHTLTIGTASE